VAFLPMGEGDDPAARMAEVFGPAQIDQLIRQAIQFCWIGMPKERRSADEVEIQVRRMFERALRDFREDRQAFGGASDG
jgi:hypothetical protein